MWRLLLLCFLHFAKPFAILDLDHLKIKIHPSQCEKNLPLVALIHSSPENFGLRNIIRQSWGESVKRIFVLGEQQKLDEKLIQEGEKYQDILQVNFNDDYRNMTYKHLIGYW